MCWCLWLLCVVFCSHSSDLPKGQAESEKNKRKRKRERASDVVEDSEEDRPKSKKKKSQVSFVEEVQTIESRDSELVSASPNNLNEEQVNEVVREKKKKKKKKKKKMTGKENEPISPVVSGKSRPLVTQRVLQTVGDTSDSSSSEDSIDKEGAGSEKSIADQAPHDAVSPAAFDTPVASSSGKKNNKVQSK